MRLRATQLRLSATDLSNFLGCRHRTALDLAAVRGARPWPPKYDDPLLEILWQRGLDHEKAYVATLAAEGRKVTDLSGLNEPDSADELVAATLAAMQAGDDVIVQGALRDGPWFGKPDVLRRVEIPGALSAWSYEVIDTKLARETKAGTILQLGLYSEMLGSAQGVRPEKFWVVTPHAEHEYRLNDYAAYFRLIRSHMLAGIELGHDQLAAMHYPEPVEHCAICPWDKQCVEKRHADDHLSLVAGISRLHRRELEARDVATLAQLARGLPDGFKPKRGSIESYVRVYEQARIQFESRGKHPPLFELRDIVEKKDEGLCRLPEPSAGDIFLDLEGDPFAGEGGREYLFGLVTVGADGQPQYRSFWGFTEHDERVAFEQVMDVITAAWKRDPDMHVYHYAPYEPAALKRLMGRYVTRELELDNLLRNGKFVDLYGVVRQGLRVGTESYSIKYLEPLYGYERVVDLAEANRNLRRMEQALWLNVPDMVPPDARDAVEGYNEDDCISTLRLRDWLEQVRAEFVGKGWEIPRPQPPEVKVQELTERQQRVEELRRKLLQDVPEASAERDEEQQARWLLAYLLDYHRREDKAVWWEYFRLRELPEEDLHDEPQAIAELEFVARVDRKFNKRTGKPTGTVTDRYRFPPQEVEIERGEVKLKDGTQLGKVVRLDRTELTVDLEKGPSRAETHPTSVFAHTFVSAKVMEDSIFEIATRVAEDGKVALIEGARDRLARSLLLALPPRLRSGEFGGKPDEEPVEFLRWTVLQLDDTVLAVQGPPGSGKTHCGAEMICALVVAGKKVGIAANSHKVIRNLLDAVNKAAVGHGQTITLAHKPDGEEYGPSPIALLKDNAAVAGALASGEAEVVGGTAWVWSRADLAGSLDVLFVDEAGQMSLANVLAMSPAAKSVVLLGDPQQLEQPRKGSHPDGVGVSALQHMLAGHVTIPDDRGVFLPATWRMCLPITAFTSELFYEGRLEAKPGLERQALSGTERFEGSGLWLVPANHDGNRTSSMEEIELVEELVRELTAEGSHWIPEEGEPRQLTGRDILIVAPYNAQVSRLAERLAPTGARVGTVDKFQGQQAPVVIYSMATSRPEDAPRGMEFLYSINRLNVATSRARCAAIVVANERLLEPECRAPRQMKLANALCRYRELARAGSAKLHK